MINIAINGFGRIGRLTLRRLLHNENVKVVAINDLADNETLTHLFRFDTAQGRFQGEVTLDGDEMIVEGQRIKIFTTRNPEDLPWKELKVDMVIECTGVFRTRESASRHITAGAKQVVISAPAKSDDVPTVVLGVNEEILTPGMEVVSNASCTTNCAAPMVQVIHNNFEIESGFLTTVHAYTADQRLQDSPHRDLRRARAAAMSIIPTTTGAAKAVGIVIPAMKGVLDGVAHRVPVSTGSFTELTLKVKKKTSIEAINKLMQEAANKNPAVIEYTEDPLVSADIVGNTHSCIFDSQLTNVHGDLVRISGWYDNEMGYAARVADLVEKLANL